VALLAQAPAAGAKASGAAAARAPAAAPAREGQGYTDIPHTQIRRITAQRLLESKQTVPHYYLTSEIKVGSAGQHLQVHHNTGMTAHGTALKDEVC
jgi:pyruvate dehydrogenase E2 component (dihydrolipoamide acetyltransferase)